MLRDKSRLENVPKYLKLARISNHALKEMIEANSWRNKSKLYQPKEITHLV